MPTTSAADEASRRALAASEAAERDGTVASHVAAAEAHARAARLHGLIEDKANEAAAQAHAKAAAAYRESAESVDDA